LHAADRSSCRSWPPPHEQGLADFEANAWSGLFLPKGTPAAIVSRLNLAVGEAMDSKVVQDRVHELGATLVSADRRSPEYLQMLVEREIAKWDETNESRQADF